MLKTEPSSFCRPTSHAANDARAFDGAVSRPPVATEIVERILALLATVGRAGEEVAVQSVAWVKRHGVDGYFSEAERRFYFFGRRPNDADITDFSWRAEAIVPLVWALHGLDQLPPLDRQVNVWELPMVASALRAPVRFAADARCRPLRVRVEQAALHADAHARILAARRHALPLPDGLHASIVQERRHALEWLTGRAKDWDRS